MIGSDELWINEAEENRPAMEILAANSRVATDDTRSDK
jgi:hypothetical protein